MSAYAFDLGIKVVHFIMDGGSSATANVRLISDEKHDLVMRANIFHKTTLEAAYAIKPSLAKQQPKNSPAKGICENRKRAASADWVPTLLYFSAVPVDDRRELD